MEAPLFYGPFTGLLRRCAQPNVPGKEGGVGSRQEYEKQVEEYVSDHKPTALWPVRMGVVGEVHGDAYQPVKRDEGAESRRGSFAAQDVVVQRESKASKGNDCDYRVGSVYPHQLAVE